MTRQFCYSVNYSKDKPSMQNWQLLKVNEVKISKHDKTVYSDKTLKVISY